MTACRVTGFGACGPLNGGFRIRVTNLAGALARHGIGLEPRPLLSAQEDRRFAGAPLALKLAIAARARRRQRQNLVDDPPADTVIIHRQADLFPTWSFERRLADGRRLILDLDDAVWLGANGRGRALVSSRKLKWLAARAELVTAGNEYLAEAMSRHAARVVVVPSTVDPDVIEPRRHRDGDTLVLGWIGSPENASYLHPVLPLLSRVAETLAPRRLVLEIVGGNVQPPRGVSVRASAWSLENERDALARMDVGLMPSPDNPWTRGKCGYKALLYQAAGVPVIADDVGVARRVVRDGGFVVRDEVEWTDALVTLLSDASERARLGAAGRREVEREYSVATWSERLAELLGEEQTCAS